jgi:hypothetical protein
MHVDDLDHVPAEKGEVLLSQWLHGGPNGRQRLAFRDAGKGKIADLCG